MQIDVDATWSSPKAALTGRAVADRLRLSLRAGPICLLPRVLPNDIAAELDAMEPGALPTCDVSGPRDRVRRAVEVATAGDGQPASQTVRWLGDDVVTLLDLYAGVTGARLIRARLKLVEDDMCRTFHVDQVAYRLLTTYVGPGTQWLSPRVLDHATPNQPVDARQIHQLDRGTVAILRGAREATADRPGVLHRSPPIAGTGTARLLLCINEVAA